MFLFQNTIIKKYVTKLDSAFIAERYVAYKQYFFNFEIQENIRNCNEEQFQEGFLRALFVNILGYTLYPETNFNLVTEQKNESNAKKADGAILINNEIVGIIELKDHKTNDLSKVEQQAFGYKSHNKNAIYVITSNFEKLRFYIDNAVEFIEFNLFTLSEKDFSLLWICLAYENIAKNIPKQLKSESVSKETDITKALYRDYSEFKNSLFDDILKFNRTETTEEKISYFKKTQKLLDRLLFIFFAEDTNLLPPNSLVQIIEQWKLLKELDEYQPFYNRLKKFFGYLNTGFKGKKYEIFAYNGGLFKSDEILDRLIISDEILLKYCLKLAEYDFSSEVDVNILGHIFEHSLSEIEEITNQLVKGATESVNKRKKDGVFYTPQNITKYIVDNTVGKLCEEKKEELGIVQIDTTLIKKEKKEYLTRLDSYRQWLLSLTICDPACGSGAFLNAALNFLITEHQIIDEMIANITGASIVFQEIENVILENNLFGVDINDESVEIAKLSLWLRTAKPHRKLNSLNNNIKSGDSLISDPDIAGKKAFNWQKEFPQVFREKEKKIWHVTTATHNSRYSQRMFDYHVKCGTSVWLEPEDELVVTKTIAEIQNEKNLNIIAYNICGDHLHLLLVCDEDEVDSIVKLIKGRTAREVNKNRGVQPQVKLHGERSVSIWTQKFGLKQVDNENYLTNVIEYIRNNRVKHGLVNNGIHPIVDTSADIPANAVEAVNVIDSTSRPPAEYKGINPLVGYRSNSSPSRSRKEIEEELLFFSEKICCSIEHAFRTEYKGGFDVVIGNPPYVLCQPSNTEEEKLNYYKCFEVASYKIDLFHLFFEKAIHLLKTNGKLGFITPNTYLTNKYIKPLRKFILSNTSIDALVLNNKNVFDDASVDVATIILSKNTKVNHKIKIFESLDFTFSLIGNKDQEEWLSDSDYVFNVKKNFELNLLDCVLLGDICYSYFGIQAYDRKTSISEIKENDHYLEIIDGCDIQSFAYAIPTKYFNYVETNIKSGGDWQVYEQERIVIRQIGQVPIVGMSKSKILASNTLYSIYPKKSDVNLLYLLCILNSSVIKKYWISRYSDSKKLFPKIKGYQLKELPIKIIDKETQDVFATFATNLLVFNSDLHYKRQRFLTRLTDNFEGIRISGSLEKFDKLPFIDFLKELKKQKFFLSLKQQDEWEDFFSNYMIECNSISTQISKTKSKIDTMVDALYGLTN